MEMNLNLVDDHDKLINKGDAMVYFNSELGYDQLMIVCVGCGKKSGSAGKHIFDKQTLSYHPSIVHNEALGGCGWHGWLKNGKFTSC